MISGFVKGYQITGNKKYLDSATNSINFIETKITTDDADYRGHLKDGISKLNAYLDDYAFYVNALLDIFEVDSPTRNILKRQLAIQTSW